jgi:hypothetical protein
MDEAGQRINRREFLVGASTMVGSGLLASGWPGPAAHADPTGGDPPTRSGEADAKAAAFGDLQTGMVQANGLEFHYVEVGQGPLALCLHGFPDSPFTYRCARRSAATTRRS